MEWMPCHFCGELPDDYQDDFCHGFALCDRDSGCKAPGVAVDHETYVNPNSEEEIKKAWNDLQSQRARLEILEAMLQSDVPKQTKRRL